MKRFILCFIFCTSLYASSYNSWRWVPRSKPVIKSDPVPPLPVIVLEPIPEPKIEFTSSAPSFSSGKERLSCVPGLYLHSTGNEGSALILHHDGGVDTDIRVYLNGVCVNLDTNSSSLDQFDMNTVPWDSVSICEFREYLGAEVLWIETSSTTSSVGVCSASFSTSLFDTNSVFWNLSTDHFGLEGKVLAAENYHKFNSREVPAHNFSTALSRNFGVYSGSTRLTVSDYGTNQTDYSRFTNIQDNESLQLGKFSLENQFNLQQQGFTKEAPITWCNFSVFQVEVRDFTLGSRCRFYSPAEQVPDATLEPYISWSKDGWLISGSFFYDTSAVQDSVFDWSGVCSYKNDWLTLSLSKARTYPTLYEKNRGKSDVHAYPSYTLFTKFGYDWLSFTAKGYVYLDTIHGEDNWKYYANNSDGWGYTFRVQSQQTVKFKNDIKLAWLGNITYNRFRLMNQSNSSLNGNQVMWCPLWTGSAKVSLSCKGFTWGISGVYTGSYFSSNNNLYLYPSTFLLNTDFTFKVDSWSISCSLNNILDSKIKTLGASGYEPSRSFTVSLVKSL